MRDINVAVLGAEGKLGKDLLEMLSYESDINFKGYSREDCDVTKKDDIINAFGSTEGSVTHIINCSGYTDVDACEVHPDIAEKVNTRAPEYLAEICLQEKIHLTHISTDYVFEGMKKEPYIEQDETCPLQVYGRTKLAGEGFVKGMGNKGLVIRTSWLYGKYGKNFIDTIINKVELGVDVRVLSDQIGSPTYSMDLANVIIQLALSNKSGTFHVANQGQCSWFEFATKAIQLMNLNTDRLIPIKSENLIRKAERPRYSALSTLRLRQTLPEPIRKWEDGLYQYLIETKRLYEF